MNDNIQLSKPALLYNLDLQSEKFRGDTTKSKVPTDIPESMMSTLPPDLLASVSNS